MMRPPADVDTRSRAQSSDEELGTLTPPHSIEAEQALLGALLLKNDLYVEVSDFLTPPDFFEPLHQRIFAVLAQEIERGNRATPVTLGAIFGKTALVDEATTVGQYLGRLAAQAPTIAYARDYGRAVRDLSTRRNLLLIGQDIARAASEATPDFPPAEQIEEAEVRLLALLDNSEKGGAQPFNATVASAVERIHKSKSSSGPEGLQTSFTDVDKVLGGMEAGDLVIVAGRPGMGKSALAVNIATRLANRERQTRDGEIVPEPTPVAIFSLEMSAEQIGLRILADLADVQADKVRNGSLDEVEYRKLLKTAERVARLPIYIDATGGLSIGQLASRARRLKRKHGIGMVLVDYLQLMNSGRRTENRVQDITAVTTGLKALAKQLGVPIIALSQLSRAVENRENKRPQMSDLRESGSIEQDADSILFVYREEYYLNRDEPEHGTDEWAAWDKKMDAAKGRAEIIIGKNRHGGTGIAQVQFSETRMRFANLEKARDHG